MTVSRLLAAESLSKNSESQKLHNVKTAATARRHAQYVAKWRQRSSCRDGAKAAAISCKYFHTGASEHVVRFELDRSGTHIQKKAGRVNRQSSLQAV